MKTKKLLFLAPLVCGAVLSLINLSKSVSSESEVKQEATSQSEQEGEQGTHKVVPIQEKASSRPYPVLPVEDRRLSQETIDQIDNLTTQQFVQFYNDTGLDVPSGGPSFLENVSDDHWFLPSNNYVEGEYPIIGSNRDGSDQGWDNYLDGDRWTTLSYADHTKSATAGQIKEALYEYFNE